MKEKAWDLFFDADSAHQTNRWNLLNNNFDSIGVACNCDTAFGEICIVELGKNVEPIVPITLNHFEEAEWVEPEYVLDSAFIKDWQTWTVDYCDPSMPDYFFCLIDQVRRRRLHEVSLPEFKLPNDPTCRND